MGMGRGREADQRLQRQGVAQRATGGEEWVLDCAVSVVERWVGHRAVWGGFSAGGKGLWEWAPAAPEAGGGPEPQRATGGEDWVLDCAVSVVERWVGHRAVMRGVVGGLLIGRGGRGCGNGQGQRG